MIQCCVCSGKGEVPSYWGEASEVHVNLVHKYANGVSQSSNQQELLLNTEANQKSLTLSYKPLESRKWQREGPIFEVVSKPSENFDY